MQEDAVKPERIPLLMPPHQVKRVDDWRFSNRISSRAEAIRQLVDRGLEAVKAEGQTSGGAAS